MIDLINGMIKSNRFNLDQKTTVDGFAQKYVPNYIKNNTYYYNPPGIQFGDFIVQWSSISFKSNGTIDVVSLTFESDNKDFSKDLNIIALFNPLSNNLFVNKKGMQIYWQMPYGEIMLNWACWPDKHAFIVEIHYNHWHYVFNMKNSFVDIAWGLTKADPFDSCCLTKIRHILINDNLKTERCKLYSHNSDCFNCETTCDLIKCWNVHNQPTYKELLKEINAQEFVEDDVLISSDDAKLNGVYRTLDFELRKCNNQYEILIDGDSEQSYHESLKLLETIDRFAHIVSEWYQNLQSLN